MTYRQTDDLNADAIKVLEDNQLLHVHKELNEGGRRFINKAIRINQTGNPFSYRDFTEFRKNSFKQRVFQLRRCGLVETIMVSDCAYYRVKGFRLDPYWERLTARATEVPITDNEDFTKQDSVFQFLQEYLEDFDTPSLHNIRLHFYADYLYERLELQRKENESYDIQYILANKSFILTPKFAWDRHCSTTIIVTSKNLVQVMIKNTLKPLAYNECGIYELLAKLGEIRYYLTAYYDKIPSVTEWIFVRADFGQDCKKPVGKIFPELQFRDFVGALVRIYAKPWPDGTRRVRVEKIISPNKPVSEIIEEIILTGNISEGNNFGLS